MSNNFKYHLIGIVKENAATITMAGAILFSEYHRASAIFTADKVYDLARNNAIRNCTSDSENNLIFKDMILDEVPVYDTRGRYLGAPYPDTFVAVAITVNNDLIVINQGMHFELISRDTAANWLRMSPKCIRNGYLRDNTFCLKDKSSLIVLDAQQSQYYSNTNHRY